MPVAPLTSVYQRENRLSQISIIYFDTGDMLAYQIKSKIDPDFYSPKRTKSPRNKAANVKYNVKKMLKGVAHIEAAKETMEVDRG